MVFLVLLESNLNLFGLGVRSSVVTFCKIVISFVKFSLFFVKLYSIKRNRGQFAYNLSTVKHNFTKSDEQFTKESTILPKDLKNLLL